MATPLVAPDPASPTMCSEPMFEAKMDAPITHQPRLRPARKYSVAESCRLRATHQPTASRMPKYAAIISQSIPVMCDAAVIESFYSRDHRDCGDKRDKRDTGR